MASASNEVIKKPSIFNEDSDSDEESNVDWVKKSLKVSTSDSTTFSLHYRPNAPLPLSYQKEPYGGGAMTRQSKADIQKVLAEDPTAYQYDEVYDELQKNINDSLAAKKSDRKVSTIFQTLQNCKYRLNSAYFFLAEIHSTFTGTSRTSKTRK